jgi:ATP-binding cassette subfamily A (ABC1) protein 3
LKSFLLSNLNGSRLNPQTADDTLTITLPYSEKQRLLPIFRELEQDKNIQVDLAINSLEEAFINIGMDEETFINKMKKISSTDKNIQDNNDINKMVDFSDFSSIPIPPCISNSNLSFLINI